MGCMHQIRYNYDTDQRSDEYFLLTKGISRPLLTKG